MDPAAPNPIPGKAKDPNFLAVVAMAMVVVLLFFAGAWLVVHADGSHLVPSTHHDYEPHSYLRQPASPARAA